MLYQDGAGEGGVVEMGEGLPLLSDGGGGRCVYVYLCL